MKENISGSALNQLMECVDPTVQPYPGTLVVIVGHDERKLLHAIDLYNMKRPKISHSLVAVCNGSKQGYISELRLPPTAIGPVIYRPNTGWDIAMYAEAVLRYKFERYWFMNDDIIHIERRRWLKRFEFKMKDPNTGVVAVQAGSPRNFRTTYFGTSRLFFLAWYVTIKCGVLKKTDRCIWRQNKRAKRRKRVEGYVQAKEFELYNLTFARSCGFDFKWMDNSRMFIDENARKRKVFLRDPESVINLSTPRDGIEHFGGITIEDIWANKAKLTVDHIIQAALDRTAS